MSELKKWWKSKTLWVNIIALISMLLQANYGFIISAEEQLAILAVINLILRALTDTGLEL